MKRILPVIALLSLTALGASAQEVKKDKYDTKITVYDLNKTGKGEPRVDRQYHVDSVKATPTVNILFSQEGTDSLRLEADVPLDSVVVKNMSDGQSFKMDLGKATRPVIDLRKLPQGQLTLDVYATNGAVSSVTLDN